MTYLKTIKTPLKFFIDYAIINEQYIMEEFYMKKLAGFLAVICVLTSFSQAAFAAAQSIVINGNVAEIPAEMGEVIEQDDRTFVPIRFVSESMNKTVKYDENTNAALILDGSEMYIVQEGSYNIFRISDMGQTVVTPMDTTAFVKQYDGIGGRMYIPLRFLAEAFGYTVGWDEATQTVTIDSPQV